MEVKRCLLLIHLFISRVLSTFSTDSNEKIVMPESSTTTSISLETEEEKPGDEKISMPK